MESSLAWLSSPFSRGAMSNGVGRQPRLPNQGLLVARRASRISLPFVGTLPLPFSGPVQSPVSLGSDGLRGRLFSHRGTGPGAKPDERFACGERPAGLVLQDMLWRTGPAGDGDSTC